MSHQLLDNSLFDPASKEGTATGAGNQSNPSGSKPLIKFENAQIVENNFMDTMQPAPLQKTSRKLSPSSGRFVGARTQPGTSHRGSGSLQLSPSNENITQMTLLNRDLKQVEAWVDAQEIEMLQAIEDETSTPKKKELAQEFGRVYQNAFQMTQSMA